jgi:hypothetical protein
MRIAMQLLLLVLLTAATARADVASATKACLPATPCTTNEANATFTVATAQVVRWQANRTGGPTEGHEFWLGSSTSSPTIQLTNAAGPSVGTQFLNAGTYAIAIRFFNMGPGSYSVEYNLGAQVQLTPPTTTLASRVVGTGVGSGTAMTVRVPSSSDLPVRVTSISSSDAAHFPLSSLPSLPVNISPGTTRTFQVQFNPGATAGTFSSTLTINGQSVPPGFTFASAPATVTATANAAVPNITCAAGNCAGAGIAGTADGDVGASTTFNVAFQSSGTANLVVSSVTLVQETAGPSVFTILSGGGAGTIIPPNSRPVSIRFAPPPGEQTFCARLDIASNDPDTPVKRCYFQARAHHPVPRMTIAASTIDYGEVEIGFSFHRAIVVRNTGDAPLTISLAQLCEAPGATCAADLSHFAPDSLGGPFTIAALGEQLVEQIYTPTAVGTHTIQVRITGNDPTNPQQDVTLTGRGRLPIPIDSVLVLDRSLSMEDAAGPARKIDALRRAADLYVHLLRRGAAAATSDAIGIVRYNHTNEQYLALGSLELAGGHFAAAETALDPPSVTDPSRLGPAGTTGIGGAMQRGASMLLPPSPGGARKHVMVVLTDGIENVQPWARDVIGPVGSADPGLRVYSIGLGTQIEPDVLAQMTNVTNGRFLATADLAGVHRYELETFYFKIFSNATGMSLVVDPTIPVSINGAAPIVVGTARLVSSDRSVTFLLLDEPELRALYMLELVDPGGNVIDVGSSVAGVPVHIARRENYALYHVELPSVSMASAYTGDWIVRLTPRAVPLTITHRGNDFIAPEKGLVPIGFGVAVGSDYRMDTAAVPSNSLPGATITLTTQFTDRGAPSKGQGVVANVTPPGAPEIAGVPLFDDGTHGDVAANDSTWTTTFANTSTPGVYGFLFRGVGVNDRGELVPREDSRFVPLVVPSVPGNGGNSDDDGGQPTDDDPTGGGTSRRVWWSFHLGHDFPLGELSDSHEPAASLTLDAERPLSTAYSAYAMLGHHYFHAKFGSDLTVSNLSFNLRRYFGGGTWPRFVQAGPGIYSTGGNTSAGANLGVGILFPVKPNLGLDLGANLHGLHSRHTTSVFLDLTMGVRFRF